MLITFWVLWTATCSLLVGSSGGGAERSSTSLAARKLWLLQKYDGCASCLMKHLVWRSTLKLLFHYSLSWSWRSSWIQDFDLFLGILTSQVGPFPPCFPVALTRAPSTFPRSQSEEVLRNHQRFSPEKLTWENISPKRTYSWHLKIGQNQKGNDRLPIIHFKVLC